MISGMYFPRAIKWRYDPHNIIYNLRKYQDREIHKNVPNVEMERVINMQTWDEVQVVLASPLLSAEKSQSMEVSNPTTEVVDLT